MSPNPGRPAVPSVPSVPSVGLLWPTALFLAVALLAAAHPGGAAYGSLQLPAVDVHAHRGGAALAPENTLAAVRNALALGVDVIELDLLASAEGEIVVIHDATVDRTTNGRGFVRAMPLAEIRGLDAGAWFGARFAGERVPTLREVLDLMRSPAGERVRLNLETKYPNSGPSPPADFEERVIRLLREAGMAGRVILQSFHYPSLLKVKEIEPAIPTAALRAAAFPPPDHVAVVRSARADIYSPNYRMVTREEVEALHRAGIPVVPWTVNEAREMERLLGAGIGGMRGDGIITDHPDRLIEVLRARGIRR